MSLQIGYWGCKHERIIPHTKIRANMDILGKCGECLNQPQTDQELLQQYVNGVRRHIQTEILMSVPQATERLKEVDGWLA